MYTQKPSPGSREPAHCEFCSEFLGESNNAFNALYHGTIPHRLLLTTDNFRVFPSIGQISEGYLLIAPVQHYRALGELPEDLNRELVSVYDRVKQFLRSCYGTCIFYEHGVRGAGSGGCGIYHAHLHAVPLPAQFDPIDFLKINFRYNPISGLREIGSQSASLNAYLFYEDVNSRSYLFDTPNLASQYMRKTLATLLDIPDWDWRSAGREERLLATVTRFAEHAAETSDSRLVGH